MKVTMQVLLQFSLAILSTVFVTDSIGLGTTTIPLADLVRSVPSSVPITIPPSNANVPVGFSSLPNCSVSQHELN